MVLPDLLQPNLRIVFCGTGAGTRSGAQQSYYAGCGNKFYCVLYNAGLTPYQLVPADYMQLLNYGIGLTDLVKYKSGMDKSYLPEDYDVKAFTEKMIQYKPLLVCFNGKEAAKAFFAQQYVNYGLQKQSIENTKLFVAPSTSPTAHNYWDERPWTQLKLLIDA